MADLPKGAPGPLIAQGLSLSCEPFLVDAPDNPDVREAANFWLHDDQGRFSFPRFGIEGIAKDWDRRSEQYNVVFSDGRVYLGVSPDAAPLKSTELGKELTAPLLWTQSKSAPAAGEGPLSPVFASPQVRCECVEPFRAWKVSFAGSAIASTLDAMIAGTVDESRRVPFAMEADLEMAAPPWRVGTPIEDVDEVKGDTYKTNVMGGVEGFRFEQLCRVRGTLTVDGESYSFTGSGLRIRRRGSRAIGSYIGQCWQSALFPDGRGFGIMAIKSPENPSKLAFDEAFVFEGGRMKPARIVAVPWMDAPPSIGEGAGVVLEVEGRTVRIAGEVRGGGFSTFSFAADHSCDLPLHQGFVRYRWGDQETYGMIERISPLT